MSKMCYQRFIQLIQTVYRILFGIPALPEERKQSESEQIASEILMTIISFDIDYSSSDSGNSSLGSPSPRRHRPKVSTSTHTLAVSGPSGACKKRFSASDSKSRRKQSDLNVTGHRTKLPSPKPNTEGLSMWSLLYKNIGKDMTKVSLPVALNEPLSVLQRLCEELEYSELLDKASEMSDPYDRMVYVAAFAVSSYGSSYFRAGSKPFNPLLSETYEYICDEKGFKFVAEQVSHHPPVSACYAESKNFIFWQDGASKTKMGAKSMEIQPSGYVRVKLMRPGGDGYDLYKYNKVTTCIHNLFNAQRWVQHYGEIKITSGKITCKLTFVKANTREAKKNEIQGAVYEDEDKVVRKVFGYCCESLHCGNSSKSTCIWQLGAMPVDYELYYGFTRFAMWLNELNPETAKYLPNTDSRFRPDQRLLEEGDLKGAEAMKVQLEQAQRERRKRIEQLGDTYNPRWFTKSVLNGEETWEFNHKYWELRNNPGFEKLNIESLW